MDDSTIVSTTKRYAVQWADGSLSPSVFESVAGAVSWCANVTTAVKQIYGLSLPPEVTAYTIIETTQTLNQTPWTAVPNTEEV